MTDGGGGRNWSRRRPPRRAAKAPAAPYPWQSYRDALTGRFTAGTGQPLTRYRDALTGQFRPDPSAAPVAGRAVLSRRPVWADKAGLIVITRLIEWEGGEREPVGVRVIWPALRAARLRGEVRAADVREQERELGEERLAELNPARALEYELEQMHAAHRSAKAKRGAHSRKVNAAAREAEAARNPNRRVRV